MLKRLSLLCAAALALAACSHNGDSGNTAPADAASGAATTSTTSSNVSTATDNAAASTAEAADVTPAASSVAAPAEAESAAAATPAPPAQPFVDSGKWVEGKSYFRIDPAQPLSGHAGKIVVTEVFSYACPACNAFHPTMDRIAKSLPANAVVTYLPAAFRPDENWPVYQRAFYAAKALGVADKTYDAMFDATWKTGEAATYDLQTGRPKSKEAWPKIEDLAKVYKKYGVDPQKFVAVANSFSVNLDMKRADEQIKTWGIDGTPSIVVDGKYRFSPSSAGGTEQTVELTKWLVAKEAAGK